MDDAFEEVEMIRTKDGALFSSLQEAESHIVDKVGEEINEMLKTEEAPKCGFSVLFKLILCLCGDMDKIKKLHKITSKYL